MNAVLYAPARGDVIWLDFSPQAGREQAGRRPAVVMSSSVYNRTVGLAIVCPITSRKKGYPFEVRMPDGFPGTGVILSDQARSIDWRARNASYAGTLPDTVLTKVARNIDKLVA